jgi:hypothetical protein
MIACVHERVNIREIYPSMYSRGSLRIVFYFIMPICILLIPTAMSTLLLFLCIQTLVFSVAHPLPLQLHALLRP